MTNITQCSIDGCNNKGKLSKNGKRYFIKGYCNKHYVRQYRGISIDGENTKTPRKSVIRDGVALLPLGLKAKDGHAIVSLDHSRLEKYFWHLNAQGYAVTRNEEYKLVRLHHMVIGMPPKGKVVDHINRNKLDNRLENLRICTQHENMANRGKNGSAIYKGVTFRTVHSVGAKKLWIAQVYTKGKRISLGAYETPEEAARAYDEGAKEIHGEFAVLNFNESEE